MSGRYVVPWLAWLLTLPIVLMIGVLVVLLWLTGAVVSGGRTASTR